MYTGVQWSGNIPANASDTWFTWGWPADNHVVWYMMPITPDSQSAELDWTVAVGRDNPADCTYWITVHNRTNHGIDFEGRFAVLS